MVDKVMIISVIFFSILGCKSDGGEREKSSIDKSLSQEEITQISKETYTKFLSQDPTTAFDVYEVLLIPWALSQNGVVGDPLPPETINRNIVALAEKNNDWYGFTSYFQGNFG